MVDLSKEAIQAILTFGILTFTGTSILGASQLVELSTGSNPIEELADELDKEATSSAEKLASVLSDKLDFVWDAYKMGKSLFYTSIAFLGFVLSLFGILSFLITEPLMTMLMYEGLVIAYITHKANHDPELYGIKLIGAFMVHQVLLIEVIFKIGEFLINASYRLLMLVIENVKLVIERIPFIG